jgi:histone-lysine N-methyltransferase SETMAR
MNFKKHLRHCLLWLFDKDNSISSRAASKELKEVYGADGFHDKTCANWLKRFREGDKGIDDLEDEPRSGRPSNLNDEELRLLIEMDPKATVRELAEVLQKSVGSVWNHLRDMGLVCFLFFSSNIFSFLKVSKLGVLVPHRLSDLNKATRFVAATGNLERFENGNLNLDQVLTQDEKWVLYVNVVRKREWRKRGEHATPTAKPGLHPKKVLLCFWWDTEGPVHWELLHQGVSITAEVYCQMLDRVAAALAEKRPHRQNQIFLQDNARPHTARLTQQKLAELGWEVLDHPPYSPDLAPSDYKAFRSLQNWLNGKEFANEAELRLSIQEWIDSRNAGFWVMGFIDLPERWRKVIEYEGDYFPDE